MNLSQPTAGIVPVGGPADLAGVIPYLIGFHPHSSLVAVCLHNGMRRSGLVMRLDLPDPERHDQCAKEVVVRVEHERPDGVALVCYSDEPDVDSALPHQELIESLLDGFVDGPVEVVDALLVRAERWWSYLCDRNGCCPREGTALPDACFGAIGQAAAEAVAGGRRLLSSREELEASVRGPAATALESARFTFDRVRPLLSAESRADGKPAARARTVALVQTALARFEAGECDLSDDDVARICLGMRDTLARDEIASLVVSDRGAWIALLVELASRTPDGASAPICTTLAWVAYQYGDGALANVALDRALADDPGYRMAAMLRDSLDGQVRPSVVRSVSRAVRGSRADQGRDGGTGPVDVESGG